jgi:hypothetical protein
MSLVAAGSIAFAALWMAAGTRPDTVPGPVAPPILERVQAIGNLHTARYTYQNVFEHQTSLKPAGWATYVPGATGMVHASTRNTALLSAQAVVEAGVDLSQAQVEPTLGGRSRLILPRAQVYTPNVEAKVHNSRAGFFWYDRNLSLDAVRSLKLRIREAAVRQGIREEAEKNAEKQLKALVPEIETSYEIVFR